MTFEAALAFAILVGALVVFALDVFRIDFVAFAILGLILEVGVVCVCFLAFGTREETYLAIYAAGVFILLGMTGWAVQSGSCGSSAPGCLQVARRRWPAPWRPRC